MFTERTPALCATARTADAGQAHHGSVGLGGERTYAMNRVADMVRFDCAVGQAFKDPNCASVTGWWGSALATVSVGLRTALVPLNRSL